MTLFRSAFFTSVTLMTGLYVIIIIIIITLAGSEPCWLLRSMWACKTWGHLVLFSSK